jgi:hypothetical protein
MLRNWINGPEANQYGSVRIALHDLWQMNLVFVEDLAWYGRVISSLRTKANTAVPGPI